MNGGGGGESDPFFFTSTFLGQFSRHRVAVADPGFPKRGGGREISMRTARPCRGPRGRSTRRLSSFQQIYKGLQDGRQER